MIFGRHPLIAEIGPHSFADRVCVEQVERKKAALVLERSDTDDVGVGTARLIELTTLAVYEHCIGTLRNDGLHHQDVTLGQMRNRSEEHTSELQSLMRNSYAVFCLK